MKKFVLKNLSRKEFLHFKRTLLKIVINCPVSLQNFYPNAGYLCENNLSDKLNNAKRYIMNRKEVKEYFKSIAETFCLDNSENRIDFFNYIKFDYADNWEQNYIDCLNIGTGNFGLLGVLSAIRHYVDDNFPIVFNEPFSIAEQELIRFLLSKGSLEEAQEHYESNLHKYIVSIIKKTRCKNMDEALRQILLFKYQKQAMLTYYRNVLITKSKSLLSIINLFSLNDEELMYWDIIKDLVSEKCLDPRHYKINDLVKCRIIMPTFYERVEFESQGIYKKPCVNFKDISYLHKCAEAIKYLEQRVKYYCAK